MQRKEDDALILVSWPSCPLAHLSEVLPWTASTQGKGPSRRHGVADKDRRPLGCSFRPQQLSAGRHGAMSLQRIARCSRPFVQRQLLCVADLNFLASSEGITALATAPEGSCARALASYRKHCPAATWRFNAQVLSSNGAQFMAARITSSGVYRFPSCSGRLQYA